MKNELKKAGMSTKHIKQHMKKVLSEWTKEIAWFGSKEHNYNPFTVTPEECSIVIEAIEKHAFICGGSIASLLLGEKVNDYDVYFRTKEAAFTVASFFVKLFNQIEKLEQDLKVKYKISPNIKGEIEEYPSCKVPSEGIRSANLTYSGVPYVITGNAITLRGKIQIITRFQGEPDEIFKNFDFVHAMNCYENYNNKLHLQPEALESLLSKTLIYRGSLYPLTSLLRTRKFIKRGWRISAGQIFKIIWQINSLDLRSVSLLESQLIGVDTTYMLMFISAIKDMDMRNIDDGYLAEILDRIFD